MRYLKVLALLLFPLMVAAQGAGDYVSHTWNGEQLEVITSEGVLSVHPFSETMVKTTFDRKNVASVQLSNAVIMEPEEMKVKVKEKGGALKMNLGDNEILISKEPVTISYWRKDQLLLRENATCFQDSIFTGVKFQLDEAEKILGGGFRALPMDRRGHRLKLYNEPHYGYGLGAPNLNFSIPYVQSSKVYGLFFDNPQKGYVDIGKADTNVMEWGFIGGEMSYYVIMDHTWEGIMSSYSQLTGTQPLPPRWAMGNFTSRFGYETEEEARHIVDTMQRHRFPLDAIIIDLFWFGKGVHDSFYMGNLTWDREAWPQPEEMISDFKDKGVKTILIAEPFIMKESANFDYCAENDLLATDSAGNPFIIEDFWFGHSGLLDIFKPEARDWFWKQYDRQIKKGVAGWWGDLGEPERHPSGIRHVIGTADEVHNIYGHYWSKMLSDKYAENYPDRRLFHLNRSGYAGSQRYSVYPWSGDVSRSWSGFRAQLPSMLGMGLCGIPFMHSDLGGFALGIKDEHLYTRWLQMGAFNPVYRPHGSGIPSEPVFFSDSVKQIVRQYINLRYQMLPYNYTLSWKAHTTGMPLVRPMFFEEPGNEKLYEMHDQYMWGEQFLVAPVLDSGATERRLYLPKGQWIHFFNDKRYEGGQWITVPVDLKHIPVFVKAGTILPKASPIFTTDNYDPSKIQIAFYPGEEGKTYSYTMYEDDGKTRNAFEAGAYELITFTARQSDGVFTLNTTSNGGNYEGRPDDRTYFLSINGMEELPEKIVLNNVTYHVPGPGRKVPAGVKKAIYQEGSTKIFISPGR